MSTPNIYTPGQYWMGVDHLTAYHHEELGALFLSRGFNIVDIRRVYNDPFLQYVMRVYLLTPFSFFENRFYKIHLACCPKGLKE